MFRHAFGIVVSVLSVANAEPCMSPLHRMIGADGLLFAEYLTVHAIQLVFVLVCLVAMVDTLVGGD